MQETYIIRSRNTNEDKKQKKKKRVITSLSAFFLVVFFAVLLLHLASGFSVELADLINGTVSSYFRVGMARLSSLVPFSLFELVIILLPLVLILVVFLAVRRFKSGEGRLRFLVSLTSLVLFIYSGHLLALGVGYNTTPLSTRLNIPSVKITEQNLSDTLISLRDEINELSPLVNRDENGVSDPGYTLDQVSELICDSYAKFSDTHGFPVVFHSRVKGIAFSDVMSYLTLTGIYTYYTGEANVNTLYPAYDVVFASAHELSHQRGILRENEANFMAYLVASTSDDTYLRYSAALSMYGYVSSALYRTDKDAYYDIHRTLDSGAKADINRSNQIYREYSDTILADISNTVNDLFLKSSGTEGVISYGLVVRLTVAYFYAEGRI